VKKRIRYVGYSPDLSHPADRRRIALLADTEEFEIVSPTSINFEYTLLTPNANLIWYLKNKQGRPVYLDIVDGYLGTASNPLEDLARNILRSYQKKSALSSITYTNHLKRCIREVDGCVVASVEQLDSIRHLNQNIYVISDCHDELSSISYNPERRGILWQGFGSNLKHLLHFAPELDLVIHKSDLKLFVMTERRYKKFGNLLYDQETMKLLRSKFPKSFERVEFIDWTIENFTKIAEKCSLGIIPITPKDKFAHLKAENKLLELFSVGLPVLTSETPAYKRVFDQVGQVNNCVSEGKWGERIEALVSDPDKLLKIQMAGSNYIRNFHQKESKIEKWKRVFEEK
jgi:glycosyltransferase involved in cell wall biosynthesis